MCSSILVDLNDLSYTLSCANMKCYVIEMLNEKRFLLDRISMNKNKFQVFYLS